MPIDLDKVVTPPTFPLTEPWEISLAELARRSGKVPKLATKALGLFDRFGAVRLKPGGIGFDDDDVEWDKVIELRTMRASNLLTGKALEHEVDRIRGYLPPIPGRKWVVEKVVDLLLDLALAAQGKKAEELAAMLDAVDDKDTEELEGTVDGRVVAEVVYEGTLRKKELRAGIFATVILTRVPEVDDCLRRTAEMKGIPIVEGPEEDEHFESALERGQTLRARFDKLGDVAQRLRGRLDRSPDPDVEAGAPDEPEKETRPTEEQKELGT